MKEGEVNAIWIYNARLEADSSLGGLQKSGFLCHTQGRSCGKMWATGTWGEGHACMQEDGPHCPVQGKVYLILKSASVDSSVQFSHSVMSDSLRPHESQHARPPCPPPTPGVHSDSRPSSQWCHPAILSSVVPFSSCPQSLPASESFPMSQLFTWGGQSTGVSALASLEKMMRISTCLEMLIISVNYLEVVTGN